jgi:hypothetical protein
MELKDSKTSRKFRKRNADEYLHLGRGMSINHLKTEKSKIDPYYTSSDFFEKGIGQILKWVYYTFKSRFGRRYPYPTYPVSGDNGIYKVSSGTNSPSIMALAGDWATDTYESDTIAEKMAEHNPDFTIHLGDTYFVGTPFEIKNNFTGEDASWPKGNLGSFAILGNHEMYARGKAFFKELLPNLGMKNQVGGFDGQKAGFFCIENEYWRILGLDTGYNSIGKIPVIDMLPFCAPDSRFEDKLMTWLKEVVKIDNKEDKRGIVVLTHHQYISAFKKEKEYLAPAKQLASLLGTDRKIIWLWGHEHKFSMYEKVQVKDGVTAYGRCMGHGGMPVELETFNMNEKLAGYSKLVMFDGRERPGTSDYPLGYNGYTVLKLQDENLGIEYYDINGFLLSESWKVDYQGEIMGNISVPPDCPIGPINGKNWFDAVK